MRYANAADDALRARKNSVAFLVLTACLPGLFVECSLAYRLRPTLESVTVLGRAERSEVAVSFPLILLSIGIPYTATMV